MYEFRWNSWNLDHVPTHGVASEAAEWMVAHARQPFPARRADDQWLVWGRAPDGRFLQVVYLLDPDGTIYIIHARPLTETEKRRYRRRR